MDMQQENNVPPSCEQVCEGYMTGGQQQKCSLRCIQTGDTPRYMQMIEQFLNRPGRAAVAPSAAAPVDTSVTDRINLAVCRADKDLDVSLLEMETIVTHPLFVPLLSAIKQATFGKGERHGGAAKPFLEQPWHMLAEQHGVGFLTGQAAKKIGEAAAGKTGADWERELLGAVVYLGMALIYHREP